MPDPVKISDHKSLVGKMVFNKHGRIDEPVWIVVVWFVAMFLLGENLERAWVLVAFVALTVALAFPRWKNILGM